MNSTRFVIHAGGEKVFFTVVVCSLVQAGLQPTPALVMFGLRAVAYSSQCLASSEHTIFVTGSRGAALDPVQFEKQS
jgi:hypothetical protein